MPNPPVIAIGGSAGAIEALRHLLPLLRPEWGIAFAIVLHRNPVEEDERLELLLARWSPIEVVKARDRLPVAAGRVVVCPADVHLVIDGARFHLTAGPRENHARPAVDVTFRSVAQECGERGGGIVLSGLLDDGAAGIVALRHAGALTVAQQPDEAMYVGMPQSAIEAGAEAVAPVAAIPAMLETFARQARARVDRRPVERSENEEEGSPTRITCPDCSGVLVEAVQGGLTTYRCRVGHRFNQQTLHEQKGEEVEAKLWSAIEILEEQSEMSGRIAARAQRRGNVLVATHMEELADRYRQRADVVRGALATPKERIAMNEMVAR